MGCEDCVRWECDMFVMGVMVCMWEVCGLEVHVVCECVRGVVGSVCVCVCVGCGYCLKDV